MPHAQSLKRAPPAASHQVGLLLLGIEQLCVRLSAVLTHGIPAHLNGMGIVHEPVEDAVGQRGIASLLVLARNCNCEVRIEPRRKRLNTLVGRVALECTQSFESIRFYSDLELKPHNNLPAPRLCARAIEPVHVSKS